MAKKKRPAAPPRGIRHEAEDDCIRQTSRMVLNNRHTSPEACAFFWEAFFDKCSEEDLPTALRREIAEIAALLETSKPLKKPVAEELRRQYLESLRKKLHALEGHATVMQAPRDAHEYAQMHRAFRAGAVYAEITALLASRPLTEGNRLLIASESDAWPTLSEAARAVQKKVLPKRCRMETIKTRLHRACASGAIPYVGDGRDRRIHPGAVEGLADAIILADVREELEE